MAKSSTSSRIGHVRLNGALFHGFHGVTAWERRLGGQYEVDVDVTADLTNAARTDLVRNALNYETIFGVVRSVVEDKQFKLLEALAVHVIDAVMGAFPAALEVAVRVRKLRAPINGVLRSAEISLSIPRTQWRKIR